MSNYDCSGWATRFDVRCSDGRTIRKEAFKHHDGARVPLVWNHSHNDPLNVLGHADLEYRDEGMYAYVKFNGTEAGKAAKEQVVHGDITQFSIWANHLKQKGGDVLHGMIREVSLVLAGANPKAFIDTVICHNDESGEVFEEEAVIYTGIDFELFHSDEEDVEVETNEESEEEIVEHGENETVEDVLNTLTEKQKNAVYFLIGQVADSVTAKHSDAADEEEVVEHGEDETVEDVFNTLTEKQKQVVYALIAKAKEDATAKHSDEESQGGNEIMKNNVFEGANETTNTGVLSHSDQTEILKLAKTTSVGSLRDAMAIYSEQNGLELKHGIDEIDQLFPEYKNLGPAAPEFIERDQGWVGTVMKGVHKSPISRIRTRQMDIRGNDLRAFGYNRDKNSGRKDVAGNMKLLKRTTDPQTVYRKDSLHRDDIVDITDFDVVEYQYKVMKQNLNEELALAFMIGDGRDDGDEHKISEDHIRSIFHDDELYAIHKTVDFAAAKAELQGTNTGANFSENYIVAETLVRDSLYAREDYKGSGNLEFFCTPHMLNVMLLSRDLNGRRIYNSKADVAAALNVSAIHTAEQFEGVTRTTKDGKTKKLLGIFVNLNDYQVGCTKGGEITKFSQFDIDFNLEKYLIETRLSGALVKIKSAIVLEEEVTA